MENYSTAKKGNFSEVFVYAGFPKIRTTKGNAVVINLNSIILMFLFPTHVTSAFTCTQKKIKVLFLNSFFS